MYYFGVYLKKPYLIFILIFLMLTSNYIFLKFTLTVEGQTFAHMHRIDPPNFSFLKQF
jgi:hypothetical protein